VVSHQDDAHCYEDNYRQCCQDSKMYECRRVDHIAQIGNIEDAGF
jgi:hypothetical protein